MSTNRKLTELFIQWRDIDMTRIDTGFTRNSQWILSLLFCWMVVLQFVRSDCGWSLHVQRDGQSTAAAVLLHLRDLQTGRYWINLFSCRIVASNFRLFGIEFSARWIVRRLSASMSQGSRRIVASNKHSTIAIVLDTSQPSRFDVCIAFESVLLRLRRRWRSLSLSRNACQCFWFFWVWFFVHDA